MSVRSAAQPVNGGVLGRRRARVEALVREAGLPYQVCELVLEVVRRTRLWRSERVEVARELIAHFADGIETGASGDELTGRFGDPARAGRLIRRAKKRQRPLLWRVWIRTLQTTGVIMGVLLTAFVALFLRFNLGEPSPSRDFLAELNAPALSVPEEERAWPLYKSAILATPGVPERNELANQMMEWEHFPQIEPGLAEWDEVLAMYPRYERAVELVQEASRRGSFGRVLSHSFDPDLNRHLNIDPSDEPWDDAFGPINAPMLIGVLLPELGEMRNLWKWVCFDLRLAASRGDGDRVYEDLRATFAMGVHVSEEPVLIAGLVGAAIHAAGYRDLGWVLDGHADLLDDRQLALLAHQLGAIDYHDMARGSVVGEEAMFLDVLQHVFTDDGDGDGHLTFQGMRVLTMVESLSASTGGPDFSEVGERLIGPLAAAATASRKELREQYDAHMGLLQEQINTPMWEYTARLDREVEMLASSPVNKWRYAPLVILMPALDSATLQYKRSEMQRDAAVAAIAVELHRRRFGAFPASLSEVPGEILPAVPRDAFTGGEIGYVLRDGRPVIYSVGQDRDDDGGVPPAKGNHQAMRWRDAELVRQMLRDRAAAEEIPDGDWVLMPWPEE